MKSATLPALVVVVVVLVILLSRAIGAHREDEARIGGFCTGLAEQLDRRARLDSYGLEHMVRHHALAAGTLRLCLGRYDSTTRDRAESCARSAVTQPDADACYIPLARELAAAFEAPR